MATPLDPRLKRARENGRARMEAGTLMREPKGKGHEWVVDGRNDRARGRNREG